MEVDAADELLGCHLGDEAEDRFADVATPQVPDGVDDCASCQVDGALVRADPAELAVAGDVAPEAGGVLLDPREAEAADSGLEGPQTGAHYFVAPSDREGESVALEMGLVCLEDDVGGRVVRVRVHGIGAVEVVARREA